MVGSVEIERKFLVDELPAGVLGSAGVVIRQGYLAVADDAEVRLRERGGASTLTVKSTGSLLRSEHEVSLSREQLEALWPATAGRRLEKTRFALAHGAHTVEVDVYHGALAGLVTAEVEFASEEEAMGFTPPAWMRRELTADPRYKNRNLALNGLPPDGD